MKIYSTARWITLAAAAAVCWWCVVARAERMPTDFVAVSGERMESVSSGSGRLLISWEFVAETDSLRLTSEARDAAIITVLYEVRLLDWDGSPTTIIPGAVIDSDDHDDTGVGGATIFFNDEDFLVMRENALMFSMDASDFNIVAAYGTGEVSGRFRKKISGAARIEKPTRFSRRRIEIVITEIFLRLPPDEDE